MNEPSRVDVYLRRGLIVFAIFMALWVLTGIGWAAALYLPGR